MSQYIKSRQRPLLRPGTVGLMMAVVPGLVAAQATGAETPIAPVTPPAAAALPTVRVTGSRTNDVKPEESSSSKLTAPLLDTPKSVTVIPAAVIQQTGSVSLADALRTAPGLTFGGGEGGNSLGDRPFVRGFDAQSSTYVDGLRDNAPSSREVFNLESVEVSKGPDSAYGGRGGAGGSINLYTKAPRLDEFVAGSIGLGTDHYLRFTGDGNFRLGDNAAFRLNVMSHQNDVPGRDGPDNSRWGVAPSLAVGLNTPTRVVLSYYHLETNDTPDGGIGYNLPSTFPASGVVTLRPDDGGDRSNWYGLYDRDYRKDKTDSGTVRVEHDLSATLHLRNTTRFAKNSMDYVWTQPDDSQGNIAKGMVYRRFNSSLRSVEALANQSEISGETTLAGMKHRFVAGLELSREQAENNSYSVSGINYGTVNGVAYTKCPNGIGEASSYVCTSLTDPNPNDPWLGTLTVNPAGPTQIRTTTVSLYAFDTVEFTPQWLLNAGLRLDRYRTSQVNPPATVNNVPNVRLSYAQADNLVNGQLGLVYKPTEIGSVYVSLGTSSTPAGSTTGQGLEGQAITLVNSSELDPERNTSIELGTKWDVLNKTLSLSAAVFNIKTKNARVANSDGTTTSAGDKQAKGFELGLAGSLTREWSLFGGYTYLDAKAQNAGVTNVGTTAAPNWIPAAATGRQFATTAKHAFSLWSTYTPVRAWTVGAGVFAQSEVVGSYAYAAGTNGQTLIKRAVPGYARIDAMASYMLNRNVTFQLNVQNLTDRVYYSAASSPHYAIMAPGRSAVLSANLRY